MAHKVWIVSLDGSLAPPLSSLLASEQYDVRHIPVIPREFEPNPKPDAIVLSAVEAGMPALNFLVLAQKAVPPIPVVVVVPPDQAPIAVEALKLGAVDALVMPLKPAEVSAALRRALAKPDENSSSTLKAPCPQRAPEDSAIFVSRSPKMLELWNVATTVARTDVPLLILGESGVGKEVLARFIHRHSRRADKPIVKVNCAALPHDLLESELFGYERGAFTGAIGEKPGKFELADKGCILLDEIGEMPTSLQAKLLHVLEDGEFSRLGGKRPVKVDVRILALTNRKLNEAIPRGEFREDLYFRLSVVKMSIPPLRERIEDVPVLSSYFVKRHRAALSSTTDELPPELVDVFMRYSWPGNVRQLENTIKRYLILPDLDMELHAIQAPPPDPPQRAQQAMSAAAAVGTAGVGAGISQGDTASQVFQFPKPNESVSLKEVASLAAERAERAIVLHVLEQTNWNRSHAARRLNICYRALLNKLKKWQVHQPRAS